MADERRGCRAHARRRRVFFDACAPPGAAVRAGALKEGDTSGGPEIGSPAGIWTYRSFIDGPDRSSGFDRLDAARVDIDTMIPAGSGPTRAPCPRGMSPPARGTS
ncbi:hypothetical protein [Burkholderia pseudomallei]|uniref:hypothetical protein n=1 Tax=Burkholderia pseudomallei TaxID=28450 RepID=UPI000572333E|nr:hypothetical protein [Burkholderia pseudomallei]